VSEHFHAVNDPAAWSCRYAHPYATEGDARQYAANLQAGEGLAVTVVPCAGTEGNAAV
jgi:hypothetical protein